MPVLGSDAAEGGGAAADADVVDALDERRQSDGEAEAAAADEGEDADADADHHPDNGVNILGEADDGNHPSLTTSGDVDDSCSAADAAGGVAAAGAVTVAHPFARPSSSGTGSSSEAVAKDGGALAGASSGDAGAVGAGDEEAVTSVGGSTATAEPAEARGTGDHVETTDDGGGGGDGGGDGDGAHNGQDEQATRWHEQR